MDILIKLITVHFLADFALQGEFVALNKGKVPIIMVAHCAIQAGLSWWMVSSHPLAWLVLLVVFVTHMAVDYAKCQGRINLLQDQLLHLIILGLLALILMNQACFSACPFSKSA
jgi:hypothetical protein